jgi:hypothetical protein
MFKRLHLGLAVASALTTAAFVAPLANAGPAAPEKHPDIIGVLKHPDAGVLRHPDIVSVLYVRKSGGDPGNSIIAI